ncbi:MAG: valine--tRNA ligase [Defluviitaleaceae bacterium]|nr:valine--tRNA ligase [Defluviitaleaceae bacterium]
MDKNLDTKYDHLKVESGKYDYWLKQACFKADPTVDKPKYSVVIPPPNVTGKLHLGHAWDCALQDIIVRMKRMQGFDTLWLPGMDHAGIATQAKVEERLRADGISRYDLGRKKFLEKAWEWKEEYAAHIKEQWVTLGLSLDYSKERFTLDDGLSRAVKKVFVDLYNKGFIYRGERIINWDPAAKTALSDIEVIHKEIEGAFYHFKYMIEGTTEFLEVATTRPETMFGDVAVAVHPDDARYQHVVGKNVLIPGNKKAIPVIVDAYVDMDFGTGVVKITPAHDVNDFEVGNRHDLMRPKCMNLDGSMNELADQYEGLDRFEARKQLVADLKATGFVVKIEKHVHSVGHSERTNAIVEPYLSTQWFVKMDALAARSVKNQASDHKVHFVPNRFEHTFLQWMENIHDWCISRQLWWGHQIPAWYHQESGEVYVGMEAPVDKENWMQDEDVLDTWFSSALWPFSTLDWPDTESDMFKAYFPTSTLVTGYDIIFFWVSRMIFQSLEFTNQRPFEHVLIHGLVRAADGRKMSKSLGNGVDPMDVVKKYGADSLRYFLTTNSSPGQDLRYSEEKIESTWNFINKIWNASRFTIMNLAGMTAADVQLEGRPFNIADKFILSRLNETIKSVNDHAEKFEFGEVGRHLYHFIWEDFCSWYIEMAKVPLSGDDVEAKITTRMVLVHTLEAIVKLLHPFMPFVTEEIYGLISGIEDAIAVSPWPEERIFFQDEQAVTHFTLIRDLIKAVRNMRAEVDAPMSKAIRIYVDVKNAHDLAMLKENKAYLERFCNPSELTLEAGIRLTEETMSTIVTGATILLPMEGLINIEAEITRLTVEAKKLEAEVKRGTSKLTNEKFVSKAPAHLVEEERTKLADYEAKLAAVNIRIEALKK